MIFITLIFNNIPGMIEAGRIALHSTHHKFGNLSTDFGALCVYQNIKSWHVTGPCLNTQ